jgi:hypothetical protein
LRSGARRRCRRHNNSGMVRSKASKAPHWINRSHSSVCARVRSRKSGRDTKGPSLARAWKRASSVRS